jgi:hypothetical protein
MNWKEASEKQDNDYFIPKNWLYIYYYEALNILFRIENILRIFVYIIIKNKYGEKWTECAIEENGKTIGTIDSIAKRRLSQETSMGYISYVIKCPIMQLTAGELVNLLLSDANWAEFKDFFRGSKEIVKSKLLEIIEVRNAFAHFRPIKREDVQLIKFNINQQFTKIEEYLSAMTSINKIIRTNCNEDWYKLINGIETERCKIRCFESENKKWVKITLMYKSEIIYEREQEKRWLIRNLNINTPEILKNSPEMCENAIFISEYIPFVNTNRMPPIINKNVNFTFARESICKDKEIDKKIRDIFQKIEEETNLIMEENTAQGKYVQSVQSRASKYGNNEVWYFDDSNMRCDVSEDAIFEYWGDLSLNTEIVSDTTKYPWMPITIAPGDDIPF